MSKFIFSLVILWSSFSFSQNDSIATIPFEKILRVDCAHSHMCCAVGCSCCPELNRPQVYDTAIVQDFGEIKRYTVVERYGLASSHLPSRIQYIFEDNSGKQTRYFSASTPTNNFPLYNTRREAEAVPDYSQDFIKGVQYVFDNDKNYFLINKQGEKQELPFISEVEIDKKLIRKSVLIYNRRYFILSDKSGKQLTPLIYTKIDYYPGDNFAIVFDERGHEGVIDLQGNIIIPIEHYQTKRVTNDRIITPTGQKFILHTSEGKALTNKDYTFMNEPSDGLLAFRENDKIGFINLDGNEIIKAKYEWAYDFKCGRAAVIKNKKWGFISKEDKLVVDYQYYQVRNFSGNVAPVSVGNNTNTDKWGLIDLDGNYILEPKYDGIYDFKNGLAKVVLNGVGYGFIDEKGKEVLRPNYYIQSYSNETYFPFERIILEKNVDNKQQLFLADEKGKVKTDLSQYKSAYWLTMRNPTNDLMPYLRVLADDNKRGLVDIEGNEILPCKYTDVSGLNSDTLILYSLGFIEFYDLKSKQIFAKVEGQIKEHPVDGVIRMQKEGVENFYINTKGEHIN